MCRGNDPPAAVSLWNTFFGVYIRIEGPLGFFCTVEESLATRPHIDPI